MNADLLDRKSTHFVLWAPGQTRPALVIGELQCGAPPIMSGERTFPLAAVAGLGVLFEIAATGCGLQDGHVYHLRTAGGLDAAAAGRDRARRRNVSRYSGDAR
jgi:pullulanase